MTEALPVPTIEDLLAYQPEPDKVFARGDIGIKRDARGNRTLSFSSHGLWLSELRPTTVLDVELYRSLAKPGIIYELRAEGDNYDLDLVLSRHVSGYLRMHRLLSPRIRIYVLGLDSKQYRTEQESASILRAIYEDHWWNSATGIETTPNQTMPDLARYALMLLGVKSDARRQVRSIPREIIQTRSQASDLKKQLQKLKSTEAARRVAKAAFVSGVPSERVVKPSGVPVAPPRTVTESVPEQHTQTAAKPKPQPMPAVADKKFGLRFESSWKPAETLDVLETEVPAGLRRRIGKSEVPTNLPSSGRIWLDANCSAYFTDDGIVLISGSRLRNATNTNEATREVREFQEILVSRRLITRYTGYCEVLKPLLFKNPNVAATLVAGVVTPLVDLKEPIG